jgi:CheY-like chemotaxis protein
MAVRSLIVDDNAHFLASARDLLEREGIVVVGVASNGAEAVRLADELRPDITLVDIDLGEESGFDVARQLAAAAGRDAPQVILISTYPETDFADLVAASPAKAFLSKADLSGRAIEELVERPG